MSSFKILPCTINVCCYFYTADYVVGRSGVGGLTASDIFVRNDNDNEM